MRARAVATAIAGALLVSGCASAVSGSGSVSGSTTVRPPCSSDTPAPSGSDPAPGCAPSPSPTGSSSASGSSGGSSRWSQYARSIFATKLGDPGVLNVCAVALGATLPSGLTLEKPAAANAAGCRLDLDRPADAEPVSVAVAVDRDRHSVFPRGATRTSVSGQTVLAGPYGDGDCQREMLLPQPDVTTSVQVRVVGTPGAKVACGLTDAIVARFAAVASRAVPVPVLPTAAPSLLGIDACKVASAAGLSALPPAAGLGRPQPNDFDTGCSYVRYAASGVSEFDLTAGVLRSSTDTPIGTAVTVSGHRLYRQGASTYCSYTSKQAEGETVSAYFAPSSGTPSLDTCDQVATALGKYLDVLGLT